MKKTLIFIGLSILLSTYSFAQTAPVGPAEQKLLDALCTDLAKIDMSKITIKQEASDAFMNSFSTQADLMMGVAEEHKIDVTDQDAMRKLGIGIGIQLMKQKCAPFIKIATLMAGGKTGTETNTTQLSAGTFKRIDTKGFNYIVITDKTGSEKSFIWLRQFTGSEKFIGITAAQLTGKKLAISWQDIEVYLPTAKGYYKVKEITGIEVL